MTTVIVMLFPIWVGLPFTITKSKGQTHWGSRSIQVLRLTIFRFYGFIKIMSDSKRKTNPDRKRQKMETPGFEPGAFRMQSEYDTTTSHPHIYMDTSAVTIEFFVIEVFGIVYGLVSQ
ncbi:hypothetical protein PHYBLDRAFT_70234 [Phycomyces blakesleeanus NRRL 1555(-)]|uniref:Transmembrane protein n=1 Tax=Phycomyces blakesleeanus (strain ATCC 8743b / DSM 1359 / FGSC 10004 / NBRC 33097 / NRRL 1555) TaxID=763407 RepID=A0A167JVN1_PHYB8|nr:hypothetical protein PHYBLDRAFT_70234 [Phycomyces blakesleeanus NRRL 1555(-)]OAD66778.1 hypothetical protein PHYBLDRAFT_70234 [Phycomyces blakesleeanus NRRL 1555(-)]|eukprot:XP_018284818.1 hypothetical protein PHYBLDRAFT_70234 [Phycomyces blakesleeanus NRRL 1555(-)]